MKKEISVSIFILMLLVLFSGTVKSQIIDIKKWKGTYPEMEGSYPLSFIAFKGKIFPVPHYFVRTWPTHYYVKIGALPVTDSGEIAGATKTGLLRIASKMFERYQMKGRHEETSGIKDNTDLQKQIEEKIFNARTEQLQDLFQLARQFILLYKKVNQLDQLPNSNEVKRIMEKESDRLLLRFLMINLFGSDHGDKLEAFSEINSTLNKLLGEVDYTFSKIHFFNNYGKELLSYSFLSQ